MTQETMNLSDEVTMKKTVTKRREWGMILASIPVIIFVIIGTRSSVYGF